MDKLLQIMRRLRAPDGCPWDQQQTHESLRPYLLEEASEAVDALATGDATLMAEELGDVLLQVAFHAVIAEETNSFGYEAIEQAIVEKLIRRHPHVFADVAVDSAEQVVSNWQAIKAREKPENNSPAAVVPRSLPALMRSFELGKKLNWPKGSTQDIIQVLKQSAEPEAKLRALLLAVVDYARALGVNPELALRDAAEQRLTITDE